MRGGAEQRRRQFGIGIIRVVGRYAAPFVGCKYEALPGFDLQGMLHAAALPTLGQACQVHALPLEEGGVHAYASLALMV